MAGLNHPLENVRVIDLGRHQAGPRCAQVLSRMGAEVIKIERLGGEETRYHGPWVKKQSSYWVQYNSGKKSLSIDLRKEEGKEVLRELVKVSDVVVQNFRPGTIEKMGFGYETLKELNPPHHHGQRLGLRAVRALQGQHRLRPHRPDHVWDNLWSPARRGCRPSGPVCPSSTG